MTRFARAKGSKSSNLKAPDDSTPWEVMKEQLIQAKKDNEDNKHRQQAENQRIENYSNFLKEQKTQKRKATWCDFPVTESNKKTKVYPSSEEIKLNKRKKKQENSNVDRISEPSHEVTTQKIFTGEDISDNASKKKKKKKNKNVTNVVPESEEISTSEHTNDKTSKKKKKKKNKIMEIIPESEEVFTNKDTKDNAPKKKKKKNKIKDIVPVSEPTEKINKQTNEEIKSKQIQIDPLIEGKIKNRKKKDIDVNTIDTKKENQTNNQVNGDQKKKNKKMRGSKATRRKEINDRSFQLIINGKQVELMRYDGFPIMKKDAERLNELKKNMIDKGIPKSEVNRTIKLERRRAEKALARLKRDVCYNCRKGGHNLSDCPDLKSNIPGVDAADGVCFKCGSTEHRQFECKVQRDKEFRFANCFICKEQGHIARQCPDNPKGLYPNGGCCKLCGDVTHLRKDCPTVQSKEGTSIKLQMLDTATNIEDIELQSSAAVTVEAPKKPKKIRF